MAITREELRLLLWETAGTSFLNDTHLDLIIAMAGNRASRAAAIGWAVKGGRFSNMIDLNESGSDRRLNQLYTNCERQWRHWNEIATTEEEAEGGIFPGVTPTAFSILAEEDKHTISIFASDSYLTTINTRTYPLKRFAAVL